MYFRQFQNIFALSSLLILVSCATIDLNPSVKEEEHNATTQISDSAKPQQSVADAVTELRQVADAGVIRKIKVLGSARCLTETEAELMVADFRTSMDADLKARTKVAEGAKSNGGVLLARQIKDLTDRFENYMNPSSDQRILDQITKYGAQASSPRQSEICVNRMKKVAEFARVQKTKASSRIAASAVPKLGAQDPSGIEVLVPEFEKRIQGLGLYRNLIGL